MAPWIVFALLMLLMISGIHSDKAGGDNVYDGDPPNPDDLMLWADISKNGTADEDLDALYKRWYSIRPNVVPPAYQGIGGVWPTLGEIAPCAVDDAHLRVLRYCFADQASATHLSSIMLHAIAHWAPAMQYSTLRIQPDLACFHDYSCLCGPHTRHDTMSITDSRPTSGNNAGAIAETRSNVGYRSYRNSMRFGMLDNNAWRLAINGNLDAVNWAIVTMTHELGHAIGLLHEHQRPDRDAWIRVQWQNIDGYAQARQRVATVVDGFFQPTMSTDERMNLVCNSEWLANLYFPPANAFRIITPMAQGTSYAAGAHYDYDSIMHYNSDLGAVVRNGVAQLTLVKEPSTLLPGQSNFINQGGSPNNDQRAISIYDVMRVAELYPGDAYQQAAVALLPAMGKWPPQPFSIPAINFNTWVFPAP